MPKHVKDSSRPLRILIRLVKGGMLRRKKLAEEFECHPRTIDRNVDLLRELGYEIDDGVDDNNNKYYVMAEESYIWKLFGLTPQEMIALKAAQNFMSELTGTSLGDDFKALMDKIWTKLPDFTKEFFASQEDYISYRNFGISLSQVSKETIECVINALNRKKQVVLKYQDSYGNTTERNVSPIQLLHTSDRVYIYAYCHLRDGPRQFSVDKVISIEMANKDSYIPDDFIPNSFLQDALFAFSGGEKQHFKIKVWGKALEKLRRVTYHRTQKLIENDDGTAILTLDVCGIQEVMNIVLSFGRCAEVLEPQELRERTIETLDEWQSIYAGSNKK